MSHLYDCIEPDVISEDLLRECVREQGPQGEAGRVASEEGGIAFADVLQLRLDFRSKYLAAYNQFCKGGGQWQAGSQPWGEVLCDTWLCDN